MASVNGNGFGSLPWSRNGDKGDGKGLLAPLLDKQTDDVKLVVDVQDPSPQAQGTSFFEALLNAINVLAGVGILSTPYAVAQGGWLGLSFLFLFAGICCFTGLLLRRCLESNASLRTYPDIGHAAFGTTGRWIVAIFLYVDLFLVAVEFLILEGDNLSQLFPITDLSWGGVTVAPRVFFVTIAALIMLPTVWLRDLSSLAYVSAGGAFACLAIFLAVLWVGAVDGVGFHLEGPLLNVSGLPVAVGLYAFCYCGHAVYPSIYNSMKDRSQFNKVLVFSFLICTALYAAIGSTGFLMFGSDIQSQVTLNLPGRYVASKVAIWITLVNPFTKFALTLMPIARALEEILPYSSTERSQLLYGTAMRTLLVLCTVTFALSVPVFGYLMAFIGSFLSVSTAVIIPCVCYLVMFWKVGNKAEATVVVGIIVVGAVVAVLGTYASLVGILNSLP